MKRVLLIVIGATIGLAGALATLGGLFGSLFGGVGNTLSLPLGGGLLVAGVLILRSQLEGQTGEGAVTAQRQQLRTGLRILLIILALVAGLAGLFLSVCGMILRDGGPSNPAGLLVAGGLVLVVVAIIMIVKAVKMR